MPGMQLWQLDGEPIEPQHPRVLRSDEEANRVILLALRAGELLLEHQVHEHALVFLLEGELAVRAGEQHRDLKAPGLAYFEPGERHEVQATSECRLVLCLAPWPGEGHPRRTGAGGDA